MEVSSINSQNRALSYYCSSDHFYAEVRRRMKRLPASQHAITLISLDFDNFNYVNDLFGYEAGDLVLEKITEFFSSQLHGEELFSRLHADHFLFCLDSPETAVTARRFLDMTELKTPLKDLLPPHYSLVASGGVVVAQDDSVPLSALLDRANYARKKSKGKSSNSILFYDHKMGGEVQWQKIVTCMMESALKNREFQMYLQPKVLMKSGQIVGAEALVRWVSPQYGMIFPDRFIPIMEQNGFVCQLDFFMLEEVCRFLKECAEKELDTLPISVNFSKAHLATEHLAERIFQTVNRTGVSTHLIEIEFTENLGSCDFERLIEIVTDLKLLGFRVSLDDFGSAYSSLNCLKELPVDIIKIDKGFLNASTNTDKGRMILSKMVELIKSLRMLSVMEGIETNEQLEFLQKLSCDFGQGYFYAKPMPVTRYLEYLRDGDVLANLEHYQPAQPKETDKSYLYTIPQEFQMDNWELFTLGKNIDMGLMKGYLDGEATVQYINDRALEYLGYTRQEFREVFHNSIAAFTHPDDAAVVHKNAKQLITTGKPLAYQTRAIRKDGKIIVLKGRASCVIDSLGRPVGLYAFQDVTEDLERTGKLQTSLEDKISELETMVESERSAKEALRLSEERYRVIMEQSNDIMFDWDFTSDQIHFSEKYLQMFEMEPLTNDLTTNADIRNRIHIADMEEFERWIKNTYKNPGFSTAQFRIKDAEGHYIWVSSRSTAICDETGTPLRALGVLSNISAQKNQMDLLTIKSQRDPLTKLLNKVEICERICETLLCAPQEPGAFFIVDIDNFKGINDNLGHQLGDAVLVDISDKIRSLFRETDFVGRIGGDEIAIYMRSLHSRDEAEVRHKAEALGRSLRSSYYGSAQKYSISGSIGVALYPQHGASFEELYRLADIALYESKHRGKDQYTIYHKNLIESVRESRTPLDWSKDFLRAYFQNDFPFRIFQMLYETKDFSTSIQMILEILGKQYQVDRVYVFQNDDNGIYVSNTYEWCAPGIASQINALQNLSIESLSAYTYQYSQEGILCCSDIRKLDQASYAVCAPQGIKSMLHCAIYNEGRMNGFIGFDMCSVYHDWTGEEIAVLGYISRILSVFLVKKDTASELQTSYQNYVEMVDNLNGYVYVVNPNTYDVLYINNATKALGVSTGQPCYKIAFGADAPCPRCPIQKLNDEVHFATEEIYSDILDRWVNSAASKLTWEGVKDAVLVCCTDISKYKMNIG